MNRLAMKHTCLSFAMTTLHTYIATIALCQNFYGGTSMAWTLARTWTNAPLSFTYKMHFRLKNQEYPPYFYQYNFPVNLRCPLERASSQAYISEWHQHQLVWVELVKPALVPTKSTGNSWFSLIFQSKMHLYVKFNGVVIIVVRGVHAMEVPPWKF